MVAVTGVAKDKSAVGFFVRGLRHAVCARLAGAAGAGGGWAGRPCV